MLFAEGRTMEIFYKGSDPKKSIKCVEKQIGWDVVHYKDGTAEPFRVVTPKGYTRGRVIL